MKKRILLRGYMAGDGHRINDLFNRVFNKSRTLAEWRWKFKENPAGLPIIYVAEDERKIVGHVACIPVMLKVGGVVTKVYQGVDLMVLPEYQGHRIFLTLMEKCFREFKKQQTIVYGLSGGKAHSIEVKKLGFHGVCNIPVLAKSLNTKVAKSDNGLIVTKIDSFDEDVNDLWNRLSNDYGILAVRNQKYLNWRYVRKPDNNYVIFKAEKNNKVEGYIVLECVGCKGLIVDIFTKKERSVIEALLVEVLRYLKKRGVRTVKCPLFDDFYTKILRENNFKEEKSEMYLVVQYFSPKIPDKFLTKDKNWFITFGDSDWELEDI